MVMRKSRLEGSFGLKDFRAFIYSRCRNEPRVGETVVAVMKG